MLEIKALSPDRWMVYDVRYPAIPQGFGATSAEAMNNYKKNVFEMTHRLLYRLQKETSPAAKPAVPGEMEDGCYQVADLWKEIYRNLSLLEKELGWHSPPRNIGMEG